MRQTHDTIQVGKLWSIIISIILLIVFLMVISFISIVNIGGDEGGIVEKKFGGGKLPGGRIVAVEGENGIQAKVLEPGWHFFYWPWQYDITKVKNTIIKQGMVGIVQSADGQSLPPDTIYAPEWKNTDDMIKANHFLGPGRGYKGPQLTVLKPGNYRLNKKLFTITPAPITNVKVGTVAVIKSNVGKPTETDDRLVDKGSRGIWRVPLGEGQYYLHPQAYEVTMINTRQVKVSYTAEKERDNIQTLRPITVRSKDGYTFPVDVRVTYRIDRENTPKVVATIGDDDLVLNKLVTPTVRAIFRNNAEKVKALDYVKQRSTQEKQSTQMLTSELAKYGVTVMAVRIGDIGDKESLGDLLKTQTDREIALQEQTTIEEQQRAAEKQKDLTRTKQEAEEEKRLATAAYGVKVAEEEKKKRIIDAQAEAEQVKLLAEAKAQAYLKVSQVIGPDNAALIEIMKLVSSDKIKITPDVMVGGSSLNGSHDALMGTILRGMLNQEKTTKPKPAK